jgi:sigma-E factor negative regulatory protein RseA
MTTSATQQAERFNPDDRLAQSISAWMDGDADTSLTPEIFDESARQTWHTYHLIGDVLRTPDLALAQNPDFEARLAKALEQEVVILAPEAAIAVMNSKQGIWRQYGLSSLAMAAAVAAVVWVVRPFFAPEMGGSNVQSSVAMSAPANPSAEVAPDYVAAHRQLAGPAAVRQVSFGSVK